ncbi:MAG: hypothetical protein H0T86_11405, partial [Gemmatimonadales bacterium]|nr:hypothetical protein [Gemmatimonadales bacterium]
MTRDAQAASGTPSTRAEPTSTAASSVTCLGCGCACDDLTVHVSGGRIVDIAPPCPLGRAWFGDGGAPAETLSGGHTVSLERAVADAAELLAAARGRGLVVLAP